MAIEEKIKQANYIYNAFSMTIASEIPLPELQPGSGISDINIRIGKVPDYINGSIDSNEYYQAGKNQLLMHVPEVGSYYISNGNQIIIEPAPNAEINAVHLFLLGSSMGAILLQRGLLPIHGSAVVVNECAFIITGGQGAGKSTLAQALKARGYSILSDDIAAVGFDEAGSPWLYPSYPQQKLWVDSLNQMGNDLSSLAKVFARLDKYVVPIQDRFCATPKKLAGIYEIVADKGSETKLNQLFGIDRFSTIINNIYRLGFVPGLDLKEASFKNSVALAKQVFVSRITRRAGVFTVDEQIMLLEMDLRARGCDINNEGE